ncbi:bacteriohemerythrin [Fusibacter ferrireducens]|uniref:Hemerythrin family protein n=1 Tax=Fusibacter ferrireducens TaxID=2785058 RepID=A0ABR9ZR81_9FIRM|nr:bacteriohemerythrin [Fusibacter ferrireducens]MBF4692953.1 hemerythrin family protein [Fusibacter ferrireducens]
MLVWKKEFEFGIPAIDDQHKRLIEIGGSMFELVNDDTRDDYFDEIVAMLKELENYTVNHFRDEEALFDAVGYVGSMAHKFEHKIFVKKLETFMSDLDAVDSNQKETLLNLLNFIADWLVLHIVKTDREYVPLLLAAQK